MECAEIKKMGDIEDRHWWFLGKRDLVAKELAKRKRGLLLDIGCGAGANISRFSNYHDVVGCEVSEEALQMCRKRGSFMLVRCEAEHMPFRDGAFSIVTALDVLEHIDDDEKVMRNIRDIMKPGAELVTTVPAHMFMWSNHDALLHHKRRYSFSEFTSKVKRSGMKISKASYWNSFIFPGVLAYKFIRNLATVKTDTGETPGLINWAFYSLLRIENSLIRRINFPFGVSIYCVSSKASR